VQGEAFQGAGSGITAHDPGFFTGTCAENPLPGPSDTCWCTRRFTEQREGRTRWCRTEKSKGRPDEVAAKGLIIRIIISYLYAVADIDKERFG
jgi:hypothetical protein